MDKDTVNSQNANSKISINNFNRIAVALMQKKEYTYQEAINFLENLRLIIDCDTNALQYSNYQAALITAVNTGKRAFLGGVFIRIPKGIPLISKHSHSKLLDEYLIELGGKIIRKLPKNCITLNIGFKATSENEIEVYCDGWIGGVLTFDDTNKYENFSNDFSIAGVFAGALAVGLLFLKLSGIKPLSIVESKILSLWDIESSIDLETSKGPYLKYLPKKLWILGLGHLGQGYIWNLSFLPYTDRNLIQIYLQDFDKYYRANFSSGLLCDETSIGRYKTTFCSEWLEKLGFDTAIIQRKFDANLIRTEGEPYIALSGFDSFEPRMLLEKSGFDLIIDCGLGGSLENFDDIFIHTFPNALKTPEELWSEINNFDIYNSKVFDEFNKDNSCGYVATTLARQAISSSFVGAISGCFAICEILRGLHGGKRYDSINLSLRNFNYVRSNILSEYKNETNRNGFVEICPTQNLPSVEF